MNLQEYHQRKKQLSEEAPQFRELCLACLQPQFSCYCSHIQKVDSKIEFVILIHPIEVRRRIATGRMSHLCLEHSHLIMGHDYSLNPQVNTILQNPENHSVMLYPGMKSTNLSPLSLEQRASLFPVDKKLVIFVIDGTWATARKMVRLSQNINKLQRICFSPSQPSNFRVRKQPAPGCYSTIEAIHHSIELVGESQGFDVQSREHDRLLSVFDAMVERQLDFIQQSRDRNGGIAYRRDGNKVA